MSDTANPTNLASAPLSGASDFDARLKRTDEDRWLATRYAPVDARERLVALYLLNQELQRALRAKEAMLGKIRVQWWRETLEQVAGAAPLRRHDLAEELARVLAGRPDLHAAASALIDRYDDVLDDHLHTGGHQPGGDHEARHLGVEGALMRLAGLALDARATPEQLAIVAALGEANLALSAELPDGSTRWAAARSAARKLPARLWPAILHLRDPFQSAGPLALRTRMFWRAITRRL